MLRLSARKCLLTVDVQCHPYFQTSSLETLEVIAKIQLQYLLQIPPHCTTKTSVPLQKHCLLFLLFCCIAQIMNPTLPALPYRWNLIARQCSNLNQGLFQWNQPTTTKQLQLLKFQIITRNSCLLVLYYSLETSIVLFPKQKHL